MKIFVILLIGILLLAFLSVPPIIRTYARVRAGKILYGQQPTTVKRINRCIAILTWTNKWITIDEEPDSQRITRLNAMLNETLHPHG